MQNSDVRQLDINPNHYYVVARSSEVMNKPVSVIFWKQAIALYPNNQGQVHALEDRCPHREVKLSSGQVIGNEEEQQAYLQNSQRRNYELNRALVSVQKLMKS